MHTNKLQNTFPTLMSSTRLPQAQAATQSNDSSQYSRLAKLRYNRVEAAAGALDDSFGDDAANNCFLPVQIRKR